MADRSRAPPPSSGSPRGNPTTATPLRGKPSPPVGDPAHSKPSSLLEQALQACKDNAASVQERFAQTPSPPPPSMPLQCFVLRWADSERPRSNVVADAVSSVGITGPFYITTRGPAAVAISAPSSQENPTPLNAIVRTWPALAQAVGGSVSLSRPRDSNLTYIRVWNIQPHTTPQYLLQVLSTLFDISPEDVLELYRPTFGSATTGTCFQPTALLTLRRTTYNMASLALAGKQQVQVGDLETWYWSFNSPLGKNSRCQGCTLPHRIHTCPILQGMGTATDPDLQDLLRLANNSAKSASPPPSFPPVNTHSWVAQPATSLSYSTPVESGRPPVRDPNDPWGTNNNPRSVTNPPPSPGTGVTPAMSTSRGPTMTVPPKSTVPDHPKKGKAKRKRPSTPDSAPSIPSASPMQTSTTTLPPDASDSTMDTGQSSASQISFHFPLIPPVQSNPPPNA